ncbi:MAG TPA: alanine racemase [Anaerolineaceae bacterium]|nr:alanine racemase [Anaerolineaceae bacterium]HPN49971.1 alanine racemase [Anaerolineaceae bacterium]
MNTELYSTWIEVNLDAIRHNVRKLKLISQRPIMAIVKGNAYGHGLVEASRAAVEAGADWLGVARIEEALPLRQAGLHCGILVLGYTPPAQIPMAVVHRISVAAFDEAQAEEYASRARSCGGQLDVHAKIDSGMGRLGARAEEAADFVRDLNRIPGLQVEGLFTHYARSDEPDSDFTEYQYKRFKGVVDELEAEGILPPWVHSANSAAILYHPDTLFNLVRCGITIYGLHPSPEAPLPPGFIPALTWKARLTSIKTLPAGHRVSYGTSYVTRYKERIGVIPVGYADGFRRQKPNVVLLHGRMVKVIGRVCMDQTMLQLDEVPEARVGDEVIIIGRQGEREISADDAAARWETNNYDAVCGLAARIPRIYLSEKTHG